jgi:hypothetical protein
LDWDNLVNYDGCTAAYVCRDCGELERVQNCTDSGTVDWAWWRIRDGYCNGQGICTECGEFVSGQCYARGTVEEFTDGCITGERCTECEWEWSWGCGECDVCNPPLYGDINGDGRIDSTDVFLLRRWIAADTAGKTAIENANPNFSIANARVFGGDGVPGPDEVTQIRRWIAAVDKFPLGP